MSEVGIAAFTAEERAQHLERWQAVLSGQGLQQAQEAKAQRLYKRGPVNLMTGVLLHAAARADQGLELTELERSVLAPLERVLGTDYLHGLGRIYHQQLSGGRSAQAVPQAVSSRPLQEGFDEQSYKAAFAEVLPLVAQMPNLAVVDRKHLTDGQILDSAEFTATMAEYGFGVTGFVSATDDDTAAVAAEPFQARLELEKFYCHKAVGDQGLGKDEIYWTVAAKAAGHERTLRTNETGSVTEKKEFAITGDTVFFNTRLNGCGAAIVTLWEADDSTAEWYEKLGEALRQVVEELRWNDLFLSLIPSMELFGYVYFGLDVITTIWEHLLNEDDLVLSRGFTFGPADLAALYHNISDRRVRWEFNRDSQGMGHFTLYVRYTGDNPGNPPSGDGSYIATGWPGLFGSGFTRDLGTACNLPGRNGEVWLFKEDQYLKYSADAETILIGPDTVSGNWHGLDGTAFTSGIGAACLVPDGGDDVYFFRGSKYVRYDTDDEEHDGVKDIATSWPGLKGTIFTSDIEAACQVPGSSSDVYLFKGDQVVRYNVRTETMVYDGPWRISVAFPDLEDTIFASNLSAAFQLNLSSNKFYVFKADRYMLVQKHDF
ncbi:hemopexin repeat-containing protein [Streptosporangium sp. NPDC001559]|uniref:hemopexin repeat-containing protein n=1 Tax=Streptosporangium sp. NPDC001559 TaxID=3366187 RepID=UPI0036EBD0CA